MKKKSILGRVGIVAAALTLATTSMMSGTLARYSMSKSIGAEAVIAKWAPKITDGSNQEITTPIDLTKTIITGGGADEDQIGKLGQDRIAPGTKGSTQIVVDVTGAEVPTLCNIQVKPGTGYTFPDHLTVKIMDGTNQVGSALKPTYSTDDGEYKSPFEGQDAVDLVGNTAGKSLLFNSVRTTNAVQKKIYTLEWEWPLDPAGTPPEGEGKNYNDRDNYFGEYSTTEKKFGFELVVSLNQQGTGEEGTPVT